MKNVRVPQRVSLNGGTHNRDELYMQFEAYVRQREHNINHAQSKRLEQLQAISQLKRVLSFYRFSGHEAVCHAVIKSERELRLLIPHEKSRFHAGAVTRVTNMLNYANQYLKSIV